MKTTISLVLALGALAAHAPSQVAKGAAAPSFTFDKVWNDGPASFDDLLGKVVILDFAQTW